jgi:hypothetical protein
MKPRVSIWLLLSSDLYLFSSLVWQTMIKELEVLCNECRSNSCIEHALGIMEEKRTQENISEGISNISLTGAERVHMFLLLMWSYFLVSRISMSYGKLWLLTLLNLSHLCR